MDPQACYDRWRRAVDSGDLDEAREAAADLLRWIARGGFPPRYTTTERFRFRAWCANHEVKP